MRVTKPPTVPREGVVAAETGQLGRKRRGISLPLLPRLSLVALVVPGAHLKAPAGSGLEPVEQEELSLKPAPCPTRNSGLHAGEEL